jgi:hypothetical protein
MKDCDMAATKRAGTHGRSPAATLSCSAGRPGTDAEAIVGLLQRTSDPFSNMNGYGSGLSLSLSASMIVSPRADFEIGARGVNLNMRMRLMIRTNALAIALGAALAFSLATASNAAILPVPVGPHADLTIRVAEGCGPGFWRGPGGRCHPFAQGRLCPPGFHIGREGRRCWPN